MRLREGVCYASGEAYLLGRRQVGQTALILFLVLATGVALFAVQNAGPVTLRFGFWSLEMSLVVVVLVAAVVGAVMASLVGLPAWIRDRGRLRRQARELEALRAAPPATPPGAGDRGRSPAAPPASPHSSDP